MLMMVILGVFAASIFLELLMEWARPFWRVREAIAIICTLLTAFTSGWIALWQPTLFGVLIGLIGLFRIFNYTRIIEARMHERYLYYASRRTGLTLLALQAIIAVLWFIWDRVHARQGWWVAVAVLQLFAAVLLFVSTNRQLRRTAWLKTTAHLSDVELPTVSVAIPARNETEDLEECLRSLIASDYPKLEILVLDDCSQLRRTPEIIRSFAHDGVRFIQGEAPKETWLPKNQAYDRLTQEASGEYIVFAGVDVRVAPDSLRQLMNLMLQKNKQMVSILPWRGETAERRFALTQAMRYFWELVPPRRWFNRPPVLSTCFAIQKQSLVKAGGFIAVARAITPEAFFARKLISTDGYSFMRADQGVGIQSVKGPAEQRETAIRTRYPQLHRRPENVFVFTVAIAAFVLLPFALAAGGFWWRLGSFTQLLAGLTSIILLVTYQKMARATRTMNWWLGLLGLPIGVLYDLGILYYSMWQYEFSAVEWKGRNICIPAMHVIPHLPKID